MRSSSTSCTPIWPRSSIVVVTSCRCGTLPIVTGSSARRHAARIGRTAFFAPDTQTSPVRGSPPLMTILAIGIEGLGARDEGRGRENRAARISCLVVRHLQVNDRDALGYH